MRNEDQIVGELDATKKSYHDGQDKMTRVQLNALVTKIEALQKELVECLTQGANKCPDCGNMPHGMCKGSIKVGEMMVPLYEVGCIHCSHDYEAHPTDETKLIRHGKLAQGMTACSAVKKWNEGKRTIKTVDVPV